MYPLPGITARDKINLLKKYSGFSIRNVSTLLFISFIIFQMYITISQFKLMISK